MTSNAPRGYELADLIHEKSDARVIMGGMHVTTLPEEGIRHADQIITGEGEKVILDVVEGRRTEKIVEGIPIKNLDEVPWPDYSILKTPCEVANVISTRECPYRCTFCTTSRMFAPYRQRSIDNVIGEIRMYKRMGFRYMNFEDDNFTADKERAKEICRRMIASVVLGLDADKKEDIRRSVQFAKGIGAYQLQPAILTPYPGTPVYEQMAKSGRMLTGDWARFDMMNVVFQPKNMSPWELQEEFYRAGAYFYDAESSDEIGKVFGKEYGKRRKRFGRMARLGVWGAHFCSKHIKASIYYKLRNCDRPEPASKLHIPLTAHFTPTHCRENATINQPV